jgi:hypothetical protein
MGSVVPETFHQLPHEEQTVLLVSPREMRHNLLNSQILGITPGVSMGKDLVGEALGGQETSDLLLG